MLSCHGFRLFLNRLIGGGDGGGLSTALSLGLRRGAWSPSLDGDLDPMTGEWWVGPTCAGVQAERVFWVTQLGTLICESPDNPVRLVYSLAP